MNPVERVRALAGEWTESRVQAASESALHDISLEALALRDELLVARRRGDPSVRNLSLERALRECDALVRVIESAARVALGHVSRAVFELALDPLGFARATVTGELASRDVTLVLAEAGNVLAESGGLLLLDLRALRRPDGRCQVALAALFALNDARRPTRLAVLVGGGLPFVRATQLVTQLARADWSVGGDEDAAKRWLLEAPQRDAGR